MITHDDKPIKVEEPEAANENVVSDQTATMTAQLAEVQAQLRMAQEDELRARADYRNLVRHTQEERQKMIKMAAASILQSILPPLDHLAMATEHLKDPGLKMVYQQFQQALAAEGVTEIECLGKIFDGEFMEVIDTTPAQKGQKPGTVVKVAQKGYQLHGEVIQHAKVVVAGEAEQETK